MTTTLRILGWKSEGLRCPDHEIDLLEGRDHPFHVSLIQMPNGTGKTTTLELLRAALSGSLESQGESADIRRFRKRDSDSDRGAFGVRLQLDDKPLTVALEFDFALERVEYKTTWRSGQELGFRPPRPLRRFMNEAFVNFYIFDGELADDLLDRDKTDAGKAVESLFQVHLLDQMSGEIEKYWKRSTKAETAKGQSGLTRSQNLLHKWANRLACLEKGKQKLESSLGRIHGQIVRQEERYREEMAKEVVRMGKMQETQAQVAGLRVELDEMTKSVLDGMRGPQALSSAFADDMLAFKSGLDRVKLPESAAREWFEELSDEAECVCGRPIDEAIRAIIRDRAERYLGSDDVILLNRIKSDISEAVGASTRQPAQVLEDRIRELAEQSRKHQQADNDLTLLRREAEASDPAVANARREKDRLEAERDRIESVLEKYQDGRENIPIERLRSIDPDTVFSIEMAKKAKEGLEDEVARRTRTLELKNKRDALVRILGRARDKAKLAIANAIRDQTNERIAGLMPNNSVRVDKIENALLLRDQAGGSAGENLSVGYAFLATLFNRGNHHQLPFVVDSPVVPIDGDIRPTIGSLVPQLTEQVVAFMISTERDGFLPSLERASNGDIQYITLFRRGVNHLEDRATAMSSGVEKTQDGCRVIGEAFFNDFQVESEPG